MGIFTIILIVIAGIIVLILLAAAFAKDEYIVEQNITINKPKQTVFAYIKTMYNQNQYNNWWMMDTNARKEYIGTDGKPGYTMKWESDNKQAGKGEQEMTGIKEGERIDYVIRFEKPFENIADSYMKTESQGNQTKVTWAFTGKRNFSMRIFHILFNIKKMLGKDIYTSLENLKANLEK